jgi:hypothetical protein
MSGAGAGSPDIGTAGGVVAWSRFVERRQPGQALRHDLNSQEAGSQQPPQVTIR